MLDTLHPVQQLSMYFELLKLDCQLTIFEYS